MNNKGLKSVVVVLVLLLSGQTFYLWHSRKTPTSKNNLSWQSQSQPVNHKISTNFAADRGAKDFSQEMARLQTEVDRMFSDRYGHQGVRIPVASPTPVPDSGVKLQETPTDYVYTMDVPGMDKSHLNVAAQGNVLVISGERKEASQEKGNDFLKREESSDYFSQSVPLPENAKADNMTVEYKDGVLMVKVPKEGAEAVNNYLKKVRLI
jgi:HSP20 family protein